MNAIFRAAMILGCTFPLAPLTAQQRGLLFTVRQTATSTQCAAGSLMNLVHDENLQYVVPTAAAYSSVAYLPKVGYYEMVGDHDCDGLYFEAGGVFDKIDAILLPRDQNWQRMRPNGRNVFFSSSVAVNHAAAGWLLDPGDVARILPGAQLEVFITAAMIQNAFIQQIPMGTAINVDGAAYLDDPETGGLFLTLEDDVIDPMTAMITIRDGDVLRIPQGALMTMASPYDGAKLVIGTVAGSGVLHYGEAAIDVMVNNSGVSDTAGAAVMAVIDTDGLTFRTGGAVAHLWFSGEGLPGGAVISDLAGGSIAILNGQPLANVVGVPTTGAGVGLAAVAPSLNGLAMVPPDLEHLAVKVTQAPCAAGAINVEAGGAVPGNMVFLLLNLLPNGCPADASGAAPAGICGFPDLYPFVAMVNLGMADAYGCAAAAIYKPMLCGWHVSLQAVDFTAACTVLSPPAVVDG